MTVAYYDDALHIYPCKYTIQGSTNQHHPQLPHTYSVYKHRDKLSRRMLHSSENKIDEYSCFFIIIFHTADAQITKIPNKNKRGDYKS